MPRFVTGVVPSRATLRMSIPVVVPRNSRDSTGKRRLSATVIAYILSLLSLTRNRITRRHPRSRLPARSNAHRLVHFAGSVLTTALGVLDPVDREQRRFASVRSPCLSARGGKPGRRRTGRRECAPRGRTHLARF